MTKAGLERLVELSLGEGTRKVLHVDAELIKDRLVVRSAERLVSSLTRRGARALAAQLEEAAPETGPATPPASAPALEPPPPLLDDLVELEPLVADRTIEAKTQPAAPMPLDTEVDDRPFSHRCEDNQGPNGCTHKEHRPYDPEDPTTAGPAW